MTKKVRYLLKTLQKKTFFVKKHMGFFHFPKQCLKAFVILAIKNVQIHNYKVKKMGISAYL
ncbi:hypothetical protein D0T49_05060 [Paludibacter sp. 221]|nr:hypothetical protein [Paludibacter sp. 221]